MDMDILLSLQSFREGIGSGLAGFMAKMTFLGEVNTVLVIMAAVYWCVSRDFGTYLLMGWSGNRLVNGVMKVSACAYRPWIRDARILPYGDALTTATGYSFPSGHTTNAGTVYGGGAVRKDLPPALRITLGLVVALVALSRCFLGVHTPQDVLVGAAASLLVMGLTVKLMAWVERHPGKDWLVACAGLGLALAVALYAAFKPYPADFDAEGRLLVDGAKMANDTFKGVGWCAAFLAGWVLERRFVSFSTGVPLLRRVTRLAAGLLGYYFVSLAAAPLVKDWIGGPAGTLLSCFLQMFTVVFLIPLLFSLAEKRADAHGKAVDKAGNA